MLQSRKNVENLNKRSRTRFIGTGTTAMIIGIACFTSWHLFRPTNKVQIERHVEGAGGNQTARIPSITLMLAKGEDLELSGKQKTELEEMLKLEQIELKPLEADINSAMNEFNKQASSRNNQSLIQIQSEAKPISALSFKKRCLEQDYAARAMGVLEPSQRAKALAFARIAKVSKKISEAGKQ
jgi:hypothetical protein